MKKPLYITLCKHIFVLSTALILVSVYGCAAQKTVKKTGLVTIEGETRYNGEILPGAKIVAFKGSPLGDFVEADTGPEGGFILELEKGSYFITGKGTDPSDGRPLAAYWVGNPLNLYGAFTGKFILPFVLETDPAELTAGEGIRGHILSRERPVAGAVVFAYLDLSSELHGPPYSISSTSDEDGEFSLATMPGTYFLTARKRLDGVSRQGPLLKGDLAGYYPHNPVTLREGRGLLLDIALVKVNRPRGEGSLSPGQAIVLEGTVTDETGNPAKGVRAYLYSTSDMIGRPAFISSLTDESGQYRLEASGVGTYYLAARSHIGGPPEPGQMMGFYQGSDDHSVILRWGSHLTGLDMKILKVW